MSARRATTAKPAADPRLVAMRKAVQAARRALNLDEDTYRSALERITGKTSSTACSRAELGAVLDFFNGRSTARTVIDGGKAAEAPPARRAAPKADHPSAGKARAMWLSLYELGVVRDPSEAALEAFARRQLGCERMQWMDQGLNHKLIEPLKAMADAHGWSQDLTGIKPALRIMVLKRRLVSAQLEKLDAAGLLTEADRASALPADLSIAALERELMVEVRRLGKRIRDNDLIERLN